MIVSHQHKLIFLKARKVAGTSFEIALSKYLDGNDIVTPISRKDEKIRSDLGFQSPCNFNFGFYRPFLKDMNRQLKVFGFRPPLKYYNHIPAKVARRRLGDAIWTSYRKVSIVRNPWDRAISLFYWKTSKPGREQNLAKFSEFIAKHSAYVTTNYENYFIDGRDVIDTYIRYEHFEEDILALERQVPSLAGVWDTFSGINAKGASRDRDQTSQDIFRAHPEADATIRTKNRWEIEKFGYRL
jgi:hypothetical protein